MVNKIDSDTFYLKKYSTLISSFIFNIMDSLLYAYATTYIVNQGIKNNLIILLIGGVAAIGLYFLSDRQWFVIKVRLFGWLLVLFVCFIWFLIFDFRGIVSLLAVCFFQKFVNGAIKTLLSNQILSEAKDIQTGFTNTATLNVATVLVGFAIGSSLYKLNPSTFGLLLVIILLLTVIFIVVLHPDILKLQLLDDSAIEFNGGHAKIYDKQYFFILGVMSSVSVIWIPQLLMAFHEEHLKQVWIPFVLPGIATLVFLAIYRHIRANIDYLIYPAYIMIVLTFLLVNMFLKSALILTVVFSLVQGYSQLTQITIRRNYIEANQQMSRKILLQTLGINNQFFLISITLLKFAQVDVGVIALIVNIFSVIYLMIENKINKKGKPKAPIF